jgi:FAR-17a/AIG1-like protein
MALPMRIGWHGASLGISLWGFGQLDRMEALAGVDTSVQYGGHYQFLTICSLAATVATMSVALAQDLSEVVDVPGALRGSLALLKTFLSVVTMPTETLVSILFWTLFAIDPTLVSLSPLLEWSLKLINLPPAQRSSSHRSNATTRTTQGKR